MNQDTAGNSNRFFTNGRKLFRRLSKSIMKSHRFRIPKHEYPIRLRLWFVAFTCIIMIILALLGFTDLSRSLPLNDKLLHFLCFCLATAVFYFIIDVEEDARRVWFWRHSGLIFTTIICLFCGGVLSEFVQSMLPYKEFQTGDLVANLLGSSLGLFIAYHLERHYRHRREIARLYRPLGASVSDLEEYGDEETGTRLLPLHDDHLIVPKSVRNKSPHINDVWDEREEIFGIGGESDDEERTPGPTLPNDKRYHVNGGSVSKALDTK